MPSPSMPGPSPMEIVAALDAKAERMTTPCGHGEMVWRRWGEGQPLLLIHGSHGSWTHWIRNIEALARDYAVWAMDIPGYGESDTPPRIDDMPGIAEIMLEGIERLLPHGSPIELVAFSFGGLFGAHIARMAPERLHSLTLVDTGGLGLPIGDMAPFGSVRGLTDPAAIEAVHRNNLGILMIADPARIDDLAIYLQIENVGRSRIYPRPHVGADQTLRALEGIKTPLRAIWGARDAPHPWNEAQRQVILDLDPRTPIRILEDTGHWSMYESPERFGKALREVLA